MQRCSSIGVGVNTGGALSRTGNAGRGMEDNTTLSGSDKDGQDLEEGCQRDRTGFHSLKLKLERVETTINLNSIPI